MSEALTRHDELVRHAIEAHGGFVFKVVGDAFCAAFATAPSALAAAVHAQRDLMAADFSSVNDLRVRMALHTGEAQERGGDYFGRAVNRVARLLGVGHGGQVLVSGTTADLLHDQLPGDLGLLDLGFHGLRDLESSEHVYQLLAPELHDVFPALRSLDRLPNNLPAQLTSLVGREQEVAEIDALLKRGSLVTVTGPGGAGKTRCAIAVGAEMLSGLPGGVWLIDLAPISNASLVAGTIARTLALREVPNRPLLETLVEYLSSQSLLLILDNCEHLIAEVRTVTAELLRRCSEIRVLATSREPLNVGGEYVFRLPSLSVDASVGLFLDRALAADSRFALTDENAESVAAIATRLDGMPLALELAAARIRVLSPAQIAQRLDDRFRILTGGDRSALPRRQTLRAAIDWSYELLENGERELFRRLAVFAGDFGLTAATDVCTIQGEMDEWSVLDSVTALVDKSLVVVEPQGEERRYRLLQSMREYGLEKLREAGEERVVAERHSRYYARFASSLFHLVDALEEERWRTLVGIELDNIRAAVESTIFQGHEPQVGLSLLADLEWAELITTVQEALRWYQTAAELAGAMPSALVHARLLRHLVLLEYRAGRPLAEGEDVALRSVEVARSSNDTNEIARALANLAGRYQRAGHFDEAQRALKEAWETPEPLSQAATKMLLRVGAVLDLQQGEIDSARRKFTELVPLEREGSEAHASALLNLAELDFAVGEFAAARVAARQAKEIYTRLQSVYLVLLLSNLAAYALAAGDLDDARANLREALHVQRKTGSGWLRNVLENHALLAALLRDHERAVALLGFTDAEYVARGEVRQHTERHGYATLMALLAEVYAADELRRRMNDGARLTGEQALAHAAAIHE